MIFFAKLFFNAKAMIGAAFAWATQSAALIFAIGMVFALAWGALERHGKHKAQKVLASTEQAYRNAQADAKLAQDALNARQVATNEAVNKGSTDANSKGLDAARTAVAAYARLHPAPRCEASQTKPAAVPANPGVDAGAGEGPGMVAVAVADLDTLAAGTVRAESCRAWAAALISAGLAEGD
jgi:hypothetical protein